jgi:co-chaperonin GroES (HSP10)
MSQTMLSATNSTNLPRGVVTAEAVEKATTATDEDQIGLTLANWDVAACGQRLFVARIKHQNTRGGLYIPEEYQEQQNDGVVISAGPMAYVNDLAASGPEEEKGRRLLGLDDLDCATRRFLRPGDRITFGKWSGDTVVRKGSVKAGMDTLMVMNADAIIGVPRKVGK